jgi:hypothetical protein
VCATAWPACNPCGSSRLRLTLDGLPLCSKTTVLLRPHKDLLDDRFSEREEKRKHGRLQTQAEQHATKE